MTDYNGQDDSRKSYEQALELIRGHAMVRVAQETDGPAEIVVHRFKDGNMEEFVAPMTRTALDILASQIARLRLLLR